MPKKTTKKTKVTFQLSTDEAKEVLLMGDFNQWEGVKAQMKKNEQGYFWEKTIHLAPGRYEYKFLVDDTWQLDPKNEECSSNHFGTENNVIII